MKAHKYLAGVISISIVSTLFLNYPVSMAIDPEIPIENKIEAQLLEAIDSDSMDYYPVVLWSEDLNDSEIEDIIRDRIGYDYESLDTEFAAPSQELLDALENSYIGKPDENLDILMSNYMSLTENARSLEKEKTDLYRKTRKEIVSELNTAQTTALLDEIVDDESRIGFVSQFTPMSVCYLTEDEIWLAAENEKINGIELFEFQKMTECSAIDLGTTKTTMGITKINNEISLTGSGINIGIYEGHTVSSNYTATFGIDDSQVTIIGPEHNTGNNHSTFCAGIAAGSDGVAPGASIYSSSCYGEWNSITYNNYNTAHLSNLEALIASDVDVISISLISSNNVDCYNYFTKFIDKLIDNDPITIVCATGNNMNDYIGVPSSAYNCIAVNGFVDYANDQAQELLNDYSYLNGNGCTKPDIIAPSLNNGTSVSAPYTAGMIALMYQFKPSLAASPELTKAILMASCHRKCSKRLNSGGSITNLYETMTQGITDMQGAGIPDMYKMISIVSQHTYGNGKLTSNNNYERYVNFVQPSYNSSYINVSVAYRQTNVPSGSLPGAIDDIDIRLTNNGTYKISVDSNSSTEMIYDSLSSNQNYLLRIYKHSGNTATIPYAYAWSTNNERFNGNLKEEGIYYLRNYNSSLYLTKNSQNNRMTQQQHSTSMNTLWVFDYVSSTGKSTVKNAGITSYGLGLDSSIGNNSYYAVDKSSSSSNPIQILRNSEHGYYIIEQVVNGVTYALGINNSSSTAGSYAIWSPYNSSNNSQKWYLESANYRIGDANNDGTIDNNDVTVVQSYDAGLVTLNNLQKYLSDVNKNDSVDLGDAYGILQIISSP